MADPKKPTKDDDEPEGFIGTIRDLIHDRESRKAGGATGTGGKKRRRKIDSMVDAMESGIDEAKDAKPEY